jgi:hypothetical protein
MIVEFKDGVPQTNERLNGFFELKKKQERNGRHLRKYWSLMNLTASNLPEGMTYTVDLSNCKPELLHEIIKTIQGVESVSFGKMSQGQFNEHYSDTLDHCCKLLGTSPETVINELTGYF